MPQGFLRARTAHRNRCVAALCLSLTLAGGASAADPPRIRRDPAQTGAIALRVAPAESPAEPEDGLDLFQRIALFFERIFDDRPATPAFVDPRYGGPTTAVVEPEIVFYSGPLAAGTVIINIDRLQVYRILGGGFAERYQEQSESAVLARVGLAR